MDMLSTNILKAGALALTLVLAGCGEDNGNGGSAALGDRDFADFGREGDFIAGDMDAPVSIIEFASVTCSHCASFHVYTYPSLKSEMIDTGLVRYTMRALPTPPMTMARLGFMTASCVGEERYYAFIDALMRTQNAWAFNPDAATRRENLSQLARLAGLTEEEFEACTQNQEALDAVNAQEAEGQELGVRSTPTFFINGEMINGAMDWDSFEALIIPHLPEELRPEPAAEVEGDLEAPVDPEG